MLKTLFLAAVVGAVFCQNTCKVGEKTVKSNTFVFECMDHPIQPYEKFVGCQAKNIKNELEVVPAGGKILLAGHKVLGFISTCTAVNNRYRFESTGCFAYDLLSDTFVTIEMGSTADAAVYNPDIVLRVECRETAYGPSIGMVPKFGKVNTRS